MVLRGVHVMPTWQCNQEKKNMDPTCHIWSTSLSLFFPLPPPGLSVVSIGGCGGEGGRRSGGDHGRNWKGTVGGGHRQVGVEGTLRAHSRGRAANDGQEGTAGVAGTSEEDVGDDG